MGLWTQEGCDEGTGRLRVEAVDVHHPGGPPVGHAPDEVTDDGVFGCRRGDQGLGLGGGTARGQHDQRARVRDVVGQVLQDVSCVRVHPVQVLEHHQQT
jgi:hypothetical protein